MKKISILTLLLVALTLAGCKKEMVKCSFLAEAEPTADSKGDAKTQLNSESVVTWTSGDEITVRSLDQTGSVVATFSTGGAIDSEDPKAIFTAEVETKYTYDGNTRFIALFPHSEKNDLGKGESPTVYIDIPTEQDYVNDNTFGNTALPMVAYGGTKDGDISRILFHNLAGMVRIQLYSQEEKNLTSITFEEISGKYISGNFEVNDYQTSSPSVTPCENTGNENKPKNTLKINFDNNCTLKSTELKTFYLPLPAQKVQNNEVEYSIKMTVNAGSSRFVKSFTVPIRRNGTTKLPALNITSWNNDGTGNGSANPTLAGNGTIERPFLIYSVDDLKLVRDIFNGNGQLNGVDIKNGKYHFRIVRSDIELTQDNWPVESATTTRGAISFNGYLTYGANQTSSDPGIGNSSDVPLFYSISDGSSVIGLTVRGDKTIFTDDPVQYSPFCFINNGNITNCHVSRTSTYVIEYDGEPTNATQVGLAGLCVTNSNTGKISGCGCGATLVANNVGGICLQNNGIIQDCYASSPMKVYTIGSNTTTICAARAGGICYNHESGTITGCYFAANSAQAIETSWGGIAYYLSAGQITNCYIASSGVMQSYTSVGGIVHTMTGGKLDYCRNDADVINVLGGTSGLGGIVNTLNGDNAEVRNCIRYSPTGTFHCSVGPIGGVVALLNAGKVYNSAFYGDMSRSSVAQKGAFVSRMQGGTIANCYALQTTDLGPNTVFVGNMAESGCTIAHCYGQIETTGVELYDADEIKDNLNGWPSATGAGWPGTGDTYRQWVQTTTNDVPNPPQLTTQENYLSTPGKRRR